MRTTTQRIERANETVDRHLAEIRPRAELRCLCGNLMARLVAGGLELKCRRCRRLVVLPLVGDDEFLA